MKSDEEYIMEAIQARYDIMNWYENRPHVGLDVTDIERLVIGFDILGRMVYGNDINKIGEKHESIEIRR